MAPAAGRRRGIALFEHHSEPLAHWRVFLRRVLSSSLLGLGLIALSLFIGMAGYHGFEGLSWIDAFLNAAMILGGMGPVATVQTQAGKLFAGCYALYSGLAVLAVAGIVFGPVVHRFMHKFHREQGPRE